MDRITMIQTVGQQYLTSNIENGEFSYAQVIERTLSGHYKLDIRFYDSENKLSVLIETKPRFRSGDEGQLFDYVSLEKEYAIANNIIAILANTTNNKIKVWKCSLGKDTELLNDTKLKTIEEYADYFKAKNVNDKSAVLENTSLLNRKLHDNGIPENLRSQFVGTCLLALKNGLSYSGQMTTTQIIAGIKEILGSLLQGSMDRAVKLAVLQEKVLENQHVREIESHNFQLLLTFIRENILPYINDTSHEGQDILSYFFTTFNKYVAREDKNQAFTPNHIAHFMCKVAGIDKNTQIFDPTCGSVKFLVQAMTIALSQCETNAERDSVKRNQIIGIEYDENVFGLATTNMLIHGDGNSNIKRASCFTEKEWIENSLSHRKPKVVLMNPPYNASKSQVPKAFAETWGKSSTDPSKGLYFVKNIADCIGTGRLVTLLPMACAITTRGVISNIKQEMLENHTLDAVFSFPADMFYPGASVVACCMVFDLGKKHNYDRKTFFGYFKDDGFEKRKGIGRVDVRNRWEEIERDWLDMYEHRNTKPGKCVTASVTFENEWCAEAYMETDYSTLSDMNFINTMRDYSSFLLKHDDFSIPKEYDNKPMSDKHVMLSGRKWKKKKIIDFCDIPYKATAYNAIELQPCSADTPEAIPYITRTEENNGCKFYIQSTEDITDVEDSNAITIGDTTSTINYQQNRFICGDHMVILRSPHFNKYIGLFIVTLLNKERFRYNYGRAFNKDIIANTELLLPVVPNTDTPDWQFMEDYIKSLPYSKNI